MNKNKLSGNTPKNEREKNLIGVGMLAGALVMTAGFTALNALDGDAGRNRPSPVERVVETDVETFEELEIEKGTIVYNDTEDKYVVYLDDTEANPAQDPGWYEIDASKVVVPDQEG